MAPHSEPTRSEPAQAAAGSPAASDSTTALNSPPVPTLSVRVCRTPESLLIRVEGRGTMKVSPAVRDFAEQALAGQAEQDAGLKGISFDLAACDYLDSTFLGCLVCLHRECAKRGTRLIIHADPETRQRLLGATRLETVLHCVTDMPQPASEWVELATVALDRQEFGWHVMECHRVLAELNCPQAAAFRAVAENLSQELGDTPPPVKTGNERTANWRPGG